MDIETSVLEKKYQTMRDRPDAETTEELDTVQPRAPATSLLFCCFETGRKGDCLYSQRFVAY